MQKMHDGFFVHTTVYNAAMRSFEPQNIDIINEQSKAMHRRSV